MSESSTVVRVSALGDKPQYVDIARLDSAWSEAIHNLDQANGNVVLDLSGAEYVDHESLLYLCALASSRSNNGHRLFLRLPPPGRLAEYLVSWNFPAALEQSTNRPISDFLVEEQRDYFDRVTDEPRYQRFASGPYGRESLMATDFFEVTPVELSGDPDEDAEKEARRWRRNEQLRSILDLYLGGNSGRIASHVIYEAILNAAGHPVASNVFISSQLRGRRRPDVAKSTNVGTEESETATGVPGTPRQLIITIWDDGQPVVDTLSDALVRTGEIVSPAFGSTPRSYDFVVQDLGTESVDRKVVSSDEREVPLQSDAYLLLSAFFLGISREPHRRQHRQIDDLLPTNVRGASGLGLFLLQRTVLETFGGTITYASANKRLTIRRSNGDGADYLARLTVLRQECAVVSGNLLIVRINLKNAQ